MSVTVNFRNDTSFFVKINGIEGVIVPNSELEDKTVQWNSSENKTIDFYNDENCVGTPICQSSLNFVTNDGIFVNRGNFQDTQLLKMQADIPETPYLLVQTENDGGGKIIEWSEITPETEINLSFWNL